MILNVWKGNKGTRDEISYSREVEIPKEQFDGIDTMLFKAISLGTLTKYVYTTRQT